MNPNSGAIAAFENEDDAKAAGYTVPLEPEDAAKLLKLRREDRNAAHANALGERLKQIAATRTMTLTEKAEESNLAIELEFNRWAAEEAKKHGQK